MRAMWAALMLGGCASMGGADLLSQGLAGFERVGDANWSFAGGVAQASTGSAPSYLVSKESWKDFELTAEVFVGDPHNSGIFVRCADPKKIDATSCYEVNVFDKRPDQAGRTGAVPGYFTPPKAQVNAANKWTVIKIRAVGPRLVVTMDGVVTVDGDGPLVNAGPIALQWGAGDVRFRNVRVVGV